MHVWFGTSTGNSICRWKKEREWNLIRTHVVSTKIRGIKRNSTTEKKIQYLLSLFFLWMYVTSYALKFSSLNYSCTDNERFQLASILSSVFFKLLFASFMCLFSVHLNDFLGQLEACEGFKYSNWINFGMHVGAFQWTLITRKLNNCRQIQHIRNDLKIHSPTFC